MTNRPTREEMLKTERPDRVPVWEANRNKMIVKGQDNENFYYRWVNEKTHRGEEKLQAFLQGGYEFCTREQGLSIDGPGVDKSDGTDSRISRGVGNGLSAYLMRIPKELWVQDQRRKEETLNKPLEDEMKRKLKEASDYGRADFGTTKGRS